MEMTGKKLRLEVDALQVESFRPERDGLRDGGTVHGQNSPPCTWYGTCQVTCASTCAGPTCDPPCENDPTMYMTCVEGCYWATGDPCIAGIR
ncbi:MAG TPA: hypothetical protein VGO40_14505 [Longimicrobium sp.]|jgi:hypothetical protein|nr:hypothetical protein [Longimicrobium sp.]